MFGYASGTSDMTSRHKPPAVPMAPGAWPTARPCSLHSRLLTSMLSVFLGCWTCSSSTELNRRMRTRMYGGVAGESGRPLPLCRLREAQSPKPKALLQLHLHLLLIAIHPQHMFRTWRQFGFQRLY